MRRIDFHTEQQKADWLCAQPATDNRLPRVRIVARTLWTATRSSPQPAHALCTFAHRWVRDAIRYVGDYTGDAARPEQFLDPDSVIERGYDDCDGKARTLVAIIQAAAIDHGADAWARILPVWQRGSFVHVQALVRFRGSEKHPKALEGGWVLSDPIVCGAELGDSPEEHRRPDGRIPTC